METTTPKTPEIAKDNVLTCINQERLPGNDVAPPLTEGEEYTAKEVYVCPCGQSHVDVGLKSNYNWVSCYKCSEKMPKGDEIHWCHPSRFEIKK
jgi:hypothetical protein